MTGRRVTHLTIANVGKSTVAADDENMEAVPATATVKTVATPASTLRFEQNRTLNTPRGHSGLAARTLFSTMDLLYGRNGSLPKFRVLEVIARVPYIAWEQVAYIAITHTHGKPHFAHEIHEEVQAVRAQQDNELYHLLIIEELLQRRGDRAGFFRFRVVPQVLAWSYYHLSWALYVVRPSLSYALNAAFEDHAEHEYMQFVADHPELDDEPWVSDFADEYGAYETVGDLLRAIGLDERHHKQESLDRIAAARFGRGRKTNRFRLRRSSQRV